MKYITTYNLEKIEIENHCKIHLKALINDLPNGSLESIDGSSSCYDISSSCSRSCTWFCNKYL